MHTQRRKERAKEKEGSTEGEHLLELMYQTGFYVREISWQADRSHLLSPLSPSSQDFDMVGKSVFTYCPSYPFFYDSFK